MGEKQRMAAKKRWANTSDEERARLAKLHSRSKIIYWAGISAEEKSEHGRRASLARWGKK